MKTLFYNPTTKVIFGSEEPQDAAIQAITPDQVPDLIANGATVDPSADNLGKSDLSDRATNDAASQGAGTEGTAQGAQVGEAGNVGTQTTAAGQQAVGNSLVDASAIDANASGGQGDGAIDTGGYPRHPAVSHLAALRNKIESGEAIIMADLLRMIHAIEESL
ncbi:hypothetical protein [Caballeronia sp. dw_19]|uniref:hypothetical protein n=1 Tax=Caballeronia sp. dw_19 TaxID=2719791 RepID=UPI001BD4A6AA|nr:hypothetical protein [Caballeronia sp. dw_19]